MLIYHNSFGYSVHQETNKHIIVSILHIIDNSFAMHLYHIYYQIT